MGISIITEYSIAFAFLCLALGALFTYMLYRNSSFAKDLPKSLFYIIIGARFILISFLSFLLLGPMLKVVTREIERPIVVVSVDHSKSMVNTKDSANVVAIVKSFLSKVKTELPDEFDLKFISFGDHVSDLVDNNYSDKSTDFSSLYDAIDIKYTNRNVGAIVIASDGIFNEGSNPVYGPDRIKAPIYTLAFGDTSVRKDAAIAKVNLNKVALLGNSFPMEIVLNAKQCAGNNISIAVAEDTSVVLFTKTVSVPSSDFRINVPLFLDAKKKGISRYRISISKLDGEATYINNTTDVFINIIENKQKVLILSAAPNPDIAALKNAIESSINYEVTTSTVSDFKGRVSDYNLCILHGLPSKNNPATTYIDNFKNAGVPLWFILSANSDLSTFNNLSLGMQVANNRGSMQDVYPILNVGFSMFAFSELLTEKIKEWPPLSAPFGVYSVKSGASALLNQKIGTVTTAQPLMVFSEQGNFKSVVLGGEGIWRWRLADFNANGNQDLSNELILKTVQYLSVKDDKSPFKINVKNAFKENESVVFDAELYNESGQLTNTPEAKLTITDQNKKQFPYVFSRTEKAYTLNIGQFPIGKYTYRAEVKLGDKLFYRSGEFSVNALQLETVNTIANHQILNAISSRSGGKMFAADNYQQLIALLKKQEDLKPMSYTRKKMEDLIDFPWVFFTLIILVGMEWFIRKRSGGY
ncbi:MAG: hypothetical protein ACKOX3_06400 [Bacteroidota bacterium]